jgi:hypothetical protein
MPWPADGKLAGGLAGAGRAVRLWRCHDAHAHEAARTFVRRFSKPPAELAHLDDMAAQTRAELEAEGVADADQLRSKSMCAMARS